MNNPAKQSSDQLIETATRPQRVFQTAVVWGLGTLMITVLVTYVNYTSYPLTAWEPFAADFFTFSMVLSAIATAWLARRGRSELGLKILIGTFLIAVLAIQLLTSGLGLVLGLSAFVLTSVIAVRILPQKQAGQMALIGAGVGIVALALDLFGSSGRWPAAPGLRNFLPLLSGGLLVIYIGLTISQFRNYTLRVKLISALVVITLIPLGILAYWSQNRIQQSLLKVADEVLLSAANQTANKVDDFIESNLETVRAQAQYPALIEYLSLPPEQRPGTLEEARVQAVFEAYAHADRAGLLSYGSYLTSYALFDETGRSVIDTAELEIGLDKSDRDYFQIPVKTGLTYYVSPVRISPAIKVASLYFSSPVYSETGEVLGVLRMRYSASVLERLVMENRGLAGENSHAVLLDDYYIRLADSGEIGLFLKPIVPLEPDSLASLKAERRLPGLADPTWMLNQPDFKTGLDNYESAPVFTAALHKEDVANNVVHQERIAVAPLTEQPWLVAFYQPQNEFLAPAWQQTRLILGVTAGVAVVVVGLAFGLGQLLAGPIIRLTEVAQRVSEGDLAAQAPVESQDEIGQLAGVFNSMTTRLRRLIGSLEDQVGDRTADLALSMEVGQRASSIRNLDELLPTIVEFIRHKFDLYYAHIYFVDDVGQNLVIKAGTGAVGEQLLARRHSLPIGGISIVGRVAATGHSVVVPDTEQSDIHKPNPLLPHTRSEIAVPLVVEGRVIGVLDMQSDQVGTFTEKNLTVFEAMATQLSISIDSAQQWTLAQESQQKSIETLRQFTREAWTDKLTREKRDFGFAYDLASITPLKSKPNNGGVAVPVQVQSEQIGYISVEKPAERTWSTEEQHLMEAVAQQLGQKAENLRLFEQTQQRAAREQVARQIADKIRTSRDIDTALRTAAEELSRALGVAKAVVDLKIRPESGPQEGDSSPEESPAESENLAEPKVDDR